MVLFFFAQEGRFHRRAGKHEPNENRPRHRNRSGDQEEILPDVKWRVGWNVSNGPSKKPIDQRAPGPEYPCIARGLFSFCIESADDKSHRLHRYETWSPPFTAKILTGTITHSAVPIKNRTAISPLQFVQAASRSAIPDHTIEQLHMNFAEGRRLMRYVFGNIPTKAPSESMLPSLAARLVTDTSLIRIVLTKNTAGHVDPRLSEIHISSQCPRSLCPRPPIWLSYTKSGHPYEWYLTSVAVNSSMGIIQRSSFRLSLFCCTGVRGSW